MKIFLILVLFLFSNINIFAEDSIKIIARVNDLAITSKDLDDFIKALSLYLQDEYKDEEDLKKNALERLIEDKLILNAAKKENFQIPDYLIEARLKDVMSRFKSREEFENSLIEKGLTITKLRERIKEQYLIRFALDKYVNSRIDVSPSEVLKFYNERNNLFVLPPTYKLWIASSKDKNKLVKLTNLIKEKGIFYVEKEYQGILTDLEASKEDLRPEIYEIISKMQEGNIEIKKIDGIDYLIYLEKILESKKISFEEAKQNILNLIRQEKFKKRYKEWLEELKGNALIKIYN